MSDIGERIRFLPSLTRRFGGAATLAGGRLSSTLKLEATRDGSAAASVEKQITLCGPGDVLALKPSAIARVEPPPNSNDFEPNYFPFVEFVDPDLPWRYSLDDDSQPQRRKPWLMLLALSDAERRRLEDEDGLIVVSPVENGRERLRVTGDLLPSLDAAWALAHVHLNRYAGQPLGDFLAGAPDRHLSRIFCCRRLEASTHYFVFLVPLYEAGRNALRTPSVTSTAGQAWQASGRDEVVELPIYHRWEFMTSEGGDFESLARALAPASVAGLPIGRRAVDAALMRPNGVTGPNIWFEREGALAVPGFAESRATYARASETLPLTARLRESMNASLGAQGDEDPLVTFPVYGNLQRRVESVKPPEPDGRWPEPSPWLHELNQDFRTRAAAGLGAEVLRQNQHEYVKACWREVGKLRDVNERLRLAQAGLQAGLAIARKHVEGLDDDRFALLMAPYHAHVATQQRGSGTSYHRAFEQSGLVRGVMSQAFKRLAHRAVGIQHIRPFLPYRQTCSSLCLRRHEPPRTNPEFTKVLVELWGRTNPGFRRVPARTELLPMTPVDVGAGFRKRFDLESAIKSHLSALIRFNDGRELPERLDPVVVGPELMTPMYEPLKRLSLDYLLPGIEQLPNNGVTLMIENRRFIESYMSGVNHEMIRELAWRRFPVYRSATVFRHFWESTAVPEPAPDIRAIHGWRNVLGDNAPSGAKPSLVLVIKGDLIRRYPGTIVYALKVASRRAGRFEYWSEAYPDEPPPMETPTLIEPLFRAQVGADIQFVGFALTLENLQGDSRDGEYYFVLQENQDLPRFGLDVQSTSTRRPDLCGTSTPDGDDLSWDEVAGSLRAGYIDSFPDSLFGIGGGAATSASIAARTYQKPVRVAIHASNMLERS